MRLILNLNIRQKEPVLIIILIKGIYFVLSYFVRFFGFSLKTLASPVTRKDSFLPVFLDS